MAIPACGLVAPSWSGEGFLHRRSVGGSIPAPTLHNLGHPHIHFPKWKVVKVITSLTTPVCKPMQNCDPSHTPLFTFLFSPRRPPYLAGYHTPPTPTTSICMLSSAVCRTRLGGASGHTKEQSLAYIYVVGWWVGWYPPVGGRARPAE